LSFLRKYRAEKEAAERAQAEADLRAAITDLIPIAEGGQGRTQDSSLVLHPGEQLVYGITNGGLFEPRREPGHWSGRSAGLSVPVMDGIRFRIGKSAGTYIQGAEEPTVIDRGEISFTTRRVVFRGGKYTREWLFSKLLGVTHDAHEPWTAIQVSNRDKTSGIVYSGLAPEAVRLRLAVAIAISNGDGPEVAKELRDELTSPSGGPIAAAFNLVPSETTTPDTAPAQPLSDNQDRQAESPENDNASSTPSQLVSLPPPPKPMWATDPSGRHQYRWFSGTKWTDWVGDNGQQSSDPLESQP
jgi:hypothetical protein